VLPSVAALVPQRAKRVGPPSPAVCRTEEARRNSDESAHKLENRCRWIGPRPIPPQLVQIRSDQRLDVHVEITRVRSRVWPWRAPGPLPVFPERRVAAAGNSTCTHAHYRFEQPKCGADILQRVLCPIGRRGQCESDPLELIRGTSNAEAAANRDRADCRSLRWAVEERVLIGVEALTCIIVDPVGRRSGVRVRIVHVHA